MNKKWKHYFSLIGLFIIFDMTISASFGFAATYYIRPYDSARVNGDGTSSNWASQPEGVGCWNGPEGAKSANWTNTVGGGDTVFFVGTFIRERLNRVGVFDVDFPIGADGNYVVFRGDHPDGAGILTALVKDSALDEGLDPTNWDYVYELSFDQGASELQYGDTITNGGAATGYVTHVSKVSGDWSTGDAAGSIYIWKKSGAFNNNDPIQIDNFAYAHVNGGDASQTNTYFNDGVKIYDSKGLFEYFNSISDFQELTKTNSVTGVIGGTAGSYYEEMNTVGGGVKSGYWINPYDANNLKNNNIRFSEFPAYRYRMNRDGDYMRFYKLSFYGDAPTINAYNSGGSSDYVEWRDCYFWRTAAFIWPAGTFDHWAWIGNVHDGDGWVSAGHIYNTCTNPVASIINNWTIEESYFSGVHGGSDAHALGFQGNANDITIRYNTITDCGSGIVLWKGSCGTQNNFEITHNYIHDLNGDYELSGRSKCHGIVMQGGGQEARSGIVIAHNVLKDPRNCDFSSDDYHGLGIRTISKSGHQVKVYNNTVTGYPVSFESEGDSRDNDVDFRNNISLNPGFYHVHTNGYSANTAEDYNSYYASSDDKMWYWDKKGYTVNAYNAEVQLDSGITVNGNTLTGDPGLDSYGIPDEASDPVVDAGASVGYKYLLRSFVWPNATVGSAIPRISDDSITDIGAFTLKDTKNIPSPTNLRIQ